MSVKRWFRSLFGLPSVSGAERRRWQSTQGPKRMASDVELRELQRRRRILQADEEELAYERRQLDEDRARFECGHPVQPSRRLDENLYPYQAGLYADLFEEDHQLDEDRTCGTAAHEQAEEALSGPQANDPYCAPAPEPPAPYEPPAPAYEPPSSSSSDSGSSGGGDQ